MKARWFPARNRFTWNSSPRPLRGKIGPVDRF